eukprot:4373092-Pleurochrysis_carterae.AAC.1
MYLSGDKYDELTRYLSSVFSIFNAGFRRRPTDRVDDKGLPEWEAELLVVCDDEGGEADVQDGGDAAAANAMAGLEPPPSRDGCCTYCEERRVNWFDRAKTSAAKRRNLERSFRAAHLRPPGAVPGERVICPHCPFALTIADVSNAHSTYANLSESKQLEEQRKHRCTHAGQLPLKGKLLHNDDHDRHLSLCTSFSTLSPPSFLLPSPLARLQSSAKL